MKVRYSSETAETEIEGDEAQYLALAKVLETGGELSFNVVGDPHPYEILLEKAVVRVSPGKKVLISVENTKLTFEGDKEYLHFLSEEFKGYGVECKADYHVHIFYFDRPDFLREGSTLLTLEHY